MRFTSLILLLSILSSTVPMAQAGNPPGNVLKEVLLKGSIDGKKMFLVLGLQPGVTASKDFADTVFIDGENLSDLGANAQDFAEDLLGSDCQHDGLIGAVCDGADTTAEYAPRILSRPFKSLEKIPGAYKVDFENAKSAYYRSSNTVAGSLKYSGWAVWANIHGAYYLVIEAPARMIGNLAVTAGAVPAHIVGSLVVSAFKGAGVALQAAWFAGREVVGAAGVVAIEAYSLVSSATATTLTAVAAGGVAVFKGGKAVFIQLPRKLAYPVGVKKITNIEFKDREQVNLAEKAAMILETNSELGVSRIEKTIGQYNSKIVLFAQAEDGTEYKMGVAKVSIKTKKVTLSLDLTRKAIHGKSKDELKKQLSEILEAISA